MDREVSKKGIAWTGQEIERSKWTALRLKMHRTGRAYMGFARKIEPDEQGHKVKERGVQFDVQMNREIITTSRL